MTETTAPTPTDPVIEAAILSLISELDGVKSICPTEAAQRADGTEQWRQMLPRVRKEAIRMALAGRIHILRKGKPVDPREFKGVYRLGPVSDA
jgi:hypothetical protein